MVNVNLMLITCCVGWERERNAADICCGRISCDGACGTTIIKNSDIAGQCLPQNGIITNLCVFVFVRNGNRRTDGAFMYL